LLWRRPGRLHIIPAMSLPRNRPLQHRPPVFVHQCRELFQLRTYDRPTFDHADVVQTLQLTIRL
ncbi:hypothetical protein GNI_151720, partial [Gregarina niphandrodes]